jgi:MFS family permease
MADIPVAGAAADTGVAHRDFRLFLTGQYVTALGSSFTVFALPLLIYRETGSPVVMGVGFAVGFLPYLLFGLLIGALTDRYERTRLMAVADLCSAAVLLAAPLVSLTGSTGVGVYLVTTFLLTTLHIVSSTGTVTVVSGLVRKDDLVRANGRLQAGVSAMDVIGPTLAGAAVALVPTVSLLLVDSASFAVSAVTLLMIRTRAAVGKDVTGATSATADRRVRQLRREIGEGLRFVLGHRVLRAVAFLMVIVNFVCAGVPSQLVVLAKSHFGVGDGRLALLYAAGSAGIVVMSLAAGRISRRLPFPVLTLGALAAVGVCTVLLGVVPYYVVALPAWAGVAAFSALFNINAVSLRQRVAPERMLGRVTTTSMVLAWCAVPLGGLAGGLVAAGPAGVAHLYVGMGIVLVLLALGFVLSPLGRTKRVADIV